MIHVSCVTSQVVVAGHQVAVGTNPFQGIAYFLHGLPRKRDPDM